MNKTLIIVLREYFTRVSKKSFILLTLLMPFLFAALAVVPALLGRIKDDEQKRVVLIDHTGQYGRLFPNTEQYVFVPAARMLPDFKADTSTFAAVVEIKDLVGRNPKSVTLYSKSEIQPELLHAVEDTLTHQLRREKLEHYNIPELESIMGDVDQELTCTTIKWNKDGEATFSDTNIAMAFGFLFTFLIYMFVMAYGGMVMQSVMEEKTNRIMEIMVSSVKPFQLMIGKIIGVALVGFTQILIWGVLLTVILTVASIFFGAELGMTQMPPAAASGGVAPAALAQAAAQSEGSVMDAVMNLPFFEMGVMFVLYFVGGYLLFASFFAAVGASVNAQEDSSQFTLPVVIIMIFGFYAAMGSAENTHGPLAFWASLFPLTSPIVMMVRIPFDVPLWQEVLSLVILYGSALAMVWLAAKIYRVGILMYGKKPSLKEMLKWVRYR